MVKNKHEHETSQQSLRGRNFSPTNQLLLESITSKDRMFEYDARKREMFASPTNNIAGKMFTISPDLNYDNHRLMSEGRSSSEKNEIDYIERFNKSRSALSGIKGKRYFSMPRTHKNSKHSISSSRIGIPSYFKDAAELLLSRIEKQYRKYFNMLKTHCDGNYQL